MPELLIRFLFFSTIDGRLSFVQAAILAAAGRQYSVCRQCCRQLAKPSQDEQSRAVSSHIQSNKTNSSTRLFATVGNDEWAEEHPDIPGTIDPQRCVASLDQLFAQAACLHPLLCNKVSAWALSSGGLFPTKKHPPQFVPLPLTRHEGRQAAEIKFAKLKSVSCAIEKVGFPRLAACRQLESST